MIKKLKKILSRKLRRIADRLDPLFAQRGLILQTEKMRGILASSSVEYDDTAPEWMLRERLARGLCDEIMRELLAGNFVHTRQVTPTHPELKRVKAEVTFFVKDSRP